ncbi:hypothetical protein D9M68_322270 [compost metagenome]
MRILKLLVILLACAASGQALAGQPWPSTTSSSDPLLLAWNNGNHGGRHFNKHRHDGYRHKHYRRHDHFYGHRPHFIVTPRYYGGIIVGPQPYYYRPYYRSPRVVIQFYDPRLGIFVGSEIRDY